MVVHAVGGGVIGVAIAAAVGLGALLYFIYESSQSSNKKVHSYVSSRRSPTRTRSPAAEAPRLPPANRTRRNNGNDLIRKRGANQPNSKSISTQKPESDINNIKPAEVTSTDNKCSICMDVLGEKVLTLPCIHSFHGGCILSWLKLEGNYCPNCRQKI